MVKQPKSYLRSLGSDFPASVVVFLVALPLCMGIALGSGAPLFSGLIAGIVGGIVVGSLSGSQLSVSGPAAGLTSIVVVAITKLQVYEIFLVAVVLGGIIQLILGFAKAGILGDYIPSNVIKAMLAAIGLILILKQIPHFVGYEADFEGDETFEQKDGKNTFSELYFSIRNLLPVALIIGLVCLAIQIFWDKVLAKKSSIFKLIPSPLIVVLFGTLINEYLKAFKPELALGDSHLVNIPVAASAGEFVSFFTFPDFSKIGTTAVLTTALTLAIVASLETLLNVEASDELDPYQRVTPTNRELKAQGIGNILSGMIGGLPVTSVIVRTSANVNAGAKTKMSAIMHGILLLLCVALIPSILNKIPYTSLAAILIFTGYKLTKIGLYIDYFKKGWDQFVPFIVTILAILFTDLLVGILIGCCVSLFYVMRSNFRSSVVVENTGNNYLFLLRKDVSFLNKPIIKSKLEKVPEDSKVLIDVTEADFIDKDVIEVIEDFKHHAQLKNITVELKNDPDKEQGFGDPKFGAVVPKH
ncbi:MAG: SulP family inorganic anion transporter [Chitinophagaceae bacterium]|nr:MAG: SulP family inorganic anion transporter [Chitinophagaceae bacterium]